MFSFLGLSKLESGLIAVAVILIGYLVWTHHERAIGEAALRAADAKALVIAEQKAAQETAALQANVNAAHKEAQSAQAQADSALKSIPVVIRLCRIAPSSPAPKASSAASGVKGSGTGPDTVPQVHAVASITGPNISPGIAVILQAAERLAVIDAERQQVDAAHR
jgi:hypothetical protein